MIIAFILSIIATIVALSIFIIGKTKEKDVRGYGFLPLILAVILLLISILRVVPAGHVGVQAIYGDVKDTELKQGLHVVPPWYSVVNMSVKTEEYTMTASWEKEKEDDALRAKTKDGTTLTMDISIWYHLMPESASNVYETIGTNYPSKILRNALITAVKEEVAKYNVMDAFTVDRENVSAGILERIKVNTSDRGIAIERLNLRHIELEATLRQSIEAKLQAEQEALRMEFVLEKERQEKERKVIEAEGIAEANKVIAQSLDVNYLRWYWLDGMKNNPSTTYVVPSDGSGLPLFKDIDSVTQPTPTPFEFPNLD